MPEQKNRLVFIDQLRGFAIGAMVLVNFLGEFSTTPEFWKHHKEYMTFADVVAPLFIFIVGIGFRISFSSTKTRFGRRSAYLKAVRRYAVLTLIGILYYNPINWHDWWDALVDIGIGGLIALPVIEASLLLRFAYGSILILVFQLVFSLSPYGPWLMDHSFDGGPLGVLSWAAILVYGTIANDLLIATECAPRRAFALILGALFVIGGVLFTLPWGGIKGTWLVSQTAMTTPYVLISTGICFVLLVAFFWLNEDMKIQVPTLTVMGMNPLVLYLLHHAYVEIHGSTLPGDSPVWQAYIAGIVFYAANYAVARYLYKQRYFIKV